MAAQRRFSLRNDCYFVSVRKPKLHMLRGSPPPPSFFSAGLRALGQALMARADNTQIDVIDIERVMASFVTSRCCGCERVLCFGVRQRAP